jgi:hypothetical protein
MSDFLYCISFFRVHGEVLLYCLTDINIYLLELIGTWLLFIKCCNWFRFGFRFMVFNATFNNISVISWRSVLLVEETGVPGENHRPIASNWQTLSHNVVSSTLHLSGIRTHSVVMGTNCIFILFFSIYKFYFLTFKILSNN